MVGKLASKVPEELASVAIPGPIAPTGVEEGDEQDEPLQKMEEEAEGENYSNASGLPSVQDNSWMKVLYFAGSCSVNLILPFFNGLMLGFGELIAHEISWKFNWFRRSNLGYRIYPESRKIAARQQENPALEEKASRQAPAFL
ncbi:LAQU0S04e03818g1_1 [Lachancea quebecensis]|uniref:LAQU0S04e03818g1_1 n=1 Tax=Lachancea quebecensis TaxID=1654605 RepID=A0A0P1KZH5_9SACH|nr:LAQU0S04e03818g1_1 [Lachancea quebecensis]